MVNLKANPGSIGRVKMKKLGFYKLDISTQSSRESRGHREGLILFWAKGAAGKEEV